MNKKTEKYNNQTADYIHLKTPKYTCKYELKIFMLLINERYVYNLKR